MGNERLANGLAATGSDHEEQPIPIAEAVYLTDARGGASRRSELRPACPSVANSSLAFDALPIRVRVPLGAPPVLTQTWALDFMRDTLYDGRVFRTLNVLDEGT